MLEHGGQLRAAAQSYDIPLSDWVDLSTGINPHGWPLTPVPAECWQRLPEADDELLPAARAYYRNPSVLPVAGTQAAIQTLPLLRKHSRVGVLHPAYAEHNANWQNAGHEIVTLSAETIETELPQLNVLILINPNNPTGETFAAEKLLDWHRSLQSRKGWLIIDEAFVDSRLGLSLSSHPVQEGLIILRSIGKFFGLAGIRCGFVIAKAELLNELDERLGPWAISHPARFVASRALKDTLWQQQTRAILPVQGERLRQLLASHGLTPDGGTDLFQWVKTNRAAEFYERLLRQGILVRIFQQPESLRFGLPSHEEQWQRLSAALSGL